MKVLKAILLLTVVVCPVAESSNNRQTKAMCHEALSQGVRDGYHLFPEDVQFSYYQSRLCKPKFDLYTSFSNRVFSYRLDRDITFAITGMPSHDKRRFKKEFQGIYNQFCRLSPDQRARLPGYQRHSNQIGALLTQNTNKCREKILYDWMEDTRQPVTIEVMFKDDLSKFAVIVHSPRTGGRTVLQSVSSSGAEIQCKSDKGQEIRPGIVLEPRGRGMTAFGCKRLSNSATYISVNTGVGVSNRVWIPEYVEKSKNLIDDEKSIGVPPIRAP